MFWRFGFHSPSAVDTLLDKEDVTLEELMDEDDLLQECKTHNAKLIEYIRDPAILSRLLDYIINDDLEDRQRFKYPYIACEIFACELTPILDALLENKDLLIEFWKFLDRPSPLNSLQSSYFNRVISVMLSKKTGEMLDFIKSQENSLDKILSHLEVSAMVDMLVTILRLEELPEGAGVVEWLCSQGLMSKLISKLDPYLDPEIHSTAQQVLLEIIKISQTGNPEAPSIGPNALIAEFISTASASRLVHYMLDPEAPYSTSTLINAVPIFIDLIRHNNADFEGEAHPEISGHLEHSRMGTVDLSDMLRVFATHIGDFQKLLVNPKSINGSIKLTVGEMIPLGFERLKICELFAELLHCSNMTVVNSKPALVDDQAEMTRSDPEEIQRVHMREESELFIKPAENTSSDRTTNAMEEAPVDVPDNGEITKHKEGEEIPENILEEKKEMAVQPESGENAEVETTNDGKKSGLMDIAPTLTEKPTSDLPGDDEKQPYSANERLEFSVGDLLKSKFVECKVLPTCLVCI
ncbi:uncharacterized protein VTP21DRAFT_11474 [Calcarisporiella thermophila]|uniref:uncharacterized protein n=1 Tax=Calcarisporiella thermophila TaxID=911321 RepID=UPI003741F6DA